jgi:hypothetical protein
LARITSQEAKVTNLNLPSPLLCGHIKKKKKKTETQLEKLQNSIILGFGPLSFTIKEGEG